MENKKGASNYMPLIIGAIFVIGILWYAGVFETAPITEPDGVEGLPSDLKTTMTFYWKDKLSTTELTVNAKYYIFSKDGKLKTSGTAASGTASVDLDVNSKYTMISYLDTDGSEHLPETTEITTTNKPTQTETIKLITSSGLKIQDMTNTVDLDQNLTGSAGSTEEVRLIINANESTSAVIPAVYFNVNDTTVVDEIVMTKKDSAAGSWKSIVCPDRVSPTAATDKVWCFERETRLFSTDGNVIAYATLTYDSTNAPGDADTIVATLMDKFMYLKPGYDSIDGVIYDYENAADSDIGEADSDTATSAYSD